VENEQDQPSTGGGDVQWGLEDQMAPARGFFKELTAGSFGARALKISILLLMVLITVIYFVVDDK
jgi:hypothetical protein